jgi:hypothetical protein
MVIAPLHPSPPVTADDGVRQVHSVLDRCAPVEELSAYAASRLIADADRAVARLQSLKLAAISVVDKAQVAAESGMTGTAAWLAAHGRADGATAARDVKLAAALDDGLDLTRSALAVGDLTPDHARVIARTVEQLPAALGEDEKLVIEQALVSRAKLVDPAKLGKAARRSLDAAKRSQAEVDAHEDGVLRAEEKAARDRTRLSMVDNRDGTVTGHFTVPTLAGHILKKVVQQIASPRRFAQQAAKAAKAAGASTADEVAQATWDEFRAEDLTWEQKYGQAFVELLEHLPTDKLSGKVNATVVVTLDHDKLQASIGAAHLDTGHDLSASEVRRLACSSGVLPAVLGGKSQVLDLGRTERFFTEAQRVALATRYDSCAADQCDRPFAWSELHHEDPWFRDGQTNLDKAVPLCGFHHRRAHDPTYRHTITTDERGLKQVTFVRRT